jgi:hypothetical protein
VIRASFLTLRRTRALWLAIAAPLFIIVFRTLALLFGRASLGQFAWDNYVEANYSFWFGILIVLSLALETALLVDVDRAAGAWKLLFALPVSRVDFYLARLVTAFTLTALSGVILLVASLLDGYLLGFLNPALGLQPSVPHLGAYALALVAETTSLALVLAIYYWLSTRTASFIPPIALGIVGAMVNIVAYSSSPVQRFSPWMFGLDVARLLTRTPQADPYLGWPLAVVLTLSVGGALAVTALGAWEFSRRDVY